MERGQYPKSASPIIFDWVPSRHLVRGFFFGFFDFFSMSA